VITVVETMICGLPLIPVLMTVTTLDAIHMTKMVASIPWKDFVTSFDSIVFLSHKCQFMVIYRFVLVVSRFLSLHIG
jgi:hypothetical protein